MCELLVTTKKLVNETCTLGTKGNPLQNPCASDQGFIAVFKDYTWSLLGIGNSLSGCSSSIPRIFTAVEFHKDFISETTGMDSRTNSSLRKL